jgi:hypothetical protein
MKNYTLTLLFVLISFFVYGQCPTTNIVLSTQSDIDNFTNNYPNCTSLTHELKIDGIGSNISNLNGLSSIISGQKIFIKNTQIPDFSGLNNLENMQHLSLWGNASIQDFTGFDSLQSLGFLEMFGNINVTNFSGMPNLTSLDNISLFQNFGLSDMSQLSFIETINNVEIWSNGLNNLAGLENLQTVEGDLKISNEPLTSFSDLASLQTINGSLYLQYNEQAVDYSAFSNITTIENLYIIGSTSLTDLSGFEGVQTVTGSLRIGNNSGLIDLAGLNDLSTVEFFDIYENENFLSLKGIENLDFIGNRIFIDSNDSLLSIETLNYASPSQVDQVVIINNTSLLFCRNNFICGVISDPTVSKTIFNNASGCNSIGEVENTCNLPISTLDFNNSVQVFPNPVSETLLLEVPEDAIFEKAVLNSISGERLFFDYGPSIDFSGFPGGVYFLTIYTSKGSVTKKIIKE